MDNLRAFIDELDCIVEKLREAGLTDQEIYDLFIHKVFPDHS